MRTPLASVPSCLVLVAIVASMRAQVTLPESVVGPEAHRVALADVALAWEPLSFRIHEHLDLLVSSDAGKRQRGGDYVFALLVASDERLAATAAAEPRVAHERVVHSLAQGLAGLPFGGDGAEALPAVVWLLRHGPRGEVQDFAHIALAHIPSEATRAYFGDVLRNGSAVRSAVLRALDLVYAGRLVASVEDLQRWGGYHDERIRERANELLASRGESPAFFDLGESHGPRGDVALALARDLLVERPPVGATWAVLTPRASAPAGALPLHGYVLQEGDGEKPWRVLPATGVVVELPGEGFTMAAESLADYARRVAAFREEWVETSSIVRRRDIEAHLGILRGFRSFPGPNAAWPGCAAGLLIASWCKQSGEAEAVADLLDPLFTEAADERDVLEPPLHELAERLHAAMLHAFAGERDYGKAREFALRLCAPGLENFPHRQGAAELAEQLARRSDDFQTFVLPVPAEWRRLQRELSRPQQIAFLADRLRLCSATSPIPGLVDYTAPQRGSARSRGDGDDERINPFVELLRLDLTGAELPQLLPALACRDFMLVAGREWDGEVRAHELCRVAHAAEALVDEMAQQDLVDASAFLAGAEALARARAEVASFASAHPRRRRSDQLIECIRLGEDRDSVFAACLAVHEVDPVRAGNVLLELAKTHPEWLADVARLLACLDHPECLGEARAWLRHADGDVRFFAACLLLRHGVAAQEALPEIERVLRAGVRGEWLDFASEALLAGAEPKAREILVELLDGKRHRPTPLLVQRLLVAKMPEARALLDRAIAGEATLYLLSWTEAEAAALDRNTLLHWLDEWWRDDAPSPRGPDVDRIRRCLAADWQRLQAGEKPAMHVWRRNRVVGPLPR